MGCVSFSSFSLHTLIDGCADFENENAEMACIDNDFLLFFFKNATKKVKKKMKQHNIPDCNIPFLHIYAQIRPSQNSDDDGFSHMPAP